MGNQAISGQRASTALTKGGAQMTDHVSTEGKTPQADSPDGSLGTSLKPRHITMISIAGVIGAGLFVGSALSLIHI